MTEDLSRWTKSTEYNDCDSPVIQETLKEILKNHEKISLTNAEKAILIFNYVRDNILFGFDKKFYDYKASDVAKSKIGFCNPQSTLFTTLLRAANIPARQHFVGINMKILDGVGDIAKYTPYSDHAYTEVWLNNKWLQVDGYIVDPQLFKNAFQLLNGNSSSTAIGWGIHIDGKTEWDGKSDCLVQFVQNEKCPDISNNDFGVFDDIKSFYSSDSGTAKMNFIFRILFRFLISDDLNKKVNSVRFMN